MNEESVDINKVHDNKRDKMKQKLSETLCNLTSAEMNWLFDVKPIHALQKLSFEMQNAIKAMTQPVSSIGENLKKSKV